MWTILINVNFRPTRAQAETTLALRSKGKIKIYVCTEGENLRAKANDGGFAKQIRPIKLTGD